MNNAISFEKNLFKLYIYCAQHSTQLTRAIKQQLLSIRVSCIMPFSLPKPTHTHTNDALNTLVPCTRIKLTQMNSNKHPKRKTELACFIYKCDNSNSTRHFIENNGLHTTFILCISEDLLRCLFCVYVCLVPTFELLK